jgi:hypothetical protein
MKNMLYLNPLKEYPFLFSGGLGKAKVESVHLELNSDVKAYHVGQPLFIP